MAILDQLTDEQRRELLAEVEQFQQQQQQQQQQTDPQITIQGLDGQPITGTQEQVNAALQAQRDQLQQQQAPDNTQGVEQQQQFNQEGWKQEILQDAPTATNAALTHHLGFEPKAGFEAIGAALAQVAERLNKLDRSEFNRTHGLNLPDEELAKVEQIVKDNGWTLNQEKMNDAYLLAQAKGLVGANGAPAATPTATPRPQFNAPPAYVPPGAGSPGFPTADNPNELSDSDRAEFDRLAGEMTTSELKEYIQKSAAQIQQQNFV